MKPKEIKRLQFEARRLTVREIKPHLLLVESRTNPNAQHIVTVEMESDGSIRARCTCPWAHNGGYGCSHVLAALSHLAKNKNRSISFWLDKDDAERQKHRILRLAGNQRGADDDGLWMTTRPMPEAS
jgi:uncharacterized Zn finger protein